MPIQDIARTEVMTAGRDQSAGNLATVMAEEKVGSVVIEEDDDPVGIVTDRDLAIQVLEPREDPTEVTAEEIMTETPVTVDADQGIFEATATMADEGVRRMPVVDDGNLSGIFTLDDLVVLLTDEMTNLAGVIETESPPY
ncbi:CBS domain-containing protein [Halomicrococcus gelatinilyticus]|uniref:CBS domain-containing protein n=1 Tax=Halomicrococcus gelatinilyticus TaxID=1702103 RepID=UPI002E146B37